MPGEFWLYQLVMIMGLYAIPLKVKHCFSYSYIFDECIVCWMCIVFINTGGHEPYRGKETPIEAAVNGAQNKYADHAGEHNCKCCS